MSSIIIVGAGLAGLTCAKELVEAGHHVAVLESAPQLGGRASTFRDGEGDWVEQGLHIFLGAYTEFQKVLKDIHQDPDNILEWMTQIRMQDEGAEAVFGIDPLRAPIKTIVQLLGDNDYLSLGDKASLIPMMLPSIKTFDSLSSFDDRTVAAWWKKANGNENAFNRLVTPFCRAIQFTEPEQFSAYNFLGWIHHVVYHPTQTLVAGYRGARDETIFAPFGRYLHKRGAHIEVNTPVKLVEFSPVPPDGRATAIVLGDGRRIEADHIVLALPAWVLGDVLPAEIRELPFFEKITTLPTAPAISVQLWFDKKVVDYPDFTLIANSVTPVYQDQSDNAYPHARGSRISTVISPAEPFLQSSDEEIVATVLASLQKVRPQIQRQHVIKSAVVRHPRHLLRPTPGTMTARPTQETPVPNLWLAGDWTQQPFFGSQEGAVRSGLACASALMGRLNGPRDMKTEVPVQADETAPLPWSVRPQTS
ncbi:MAG: FAD-dependent oxidoreductase [Candidatus Methylacidiphilales bacterium]|nr:FAD-dependent oxidoreductase [Candidatus Methylacidiphilales bacterium]